MRVQVRGPIISIPTASFVDIARCRNTVFLGHRHSRAARRKYSSLPSGREDWTTTQKLYQPVRPWQTRILRLERGQFGSPLVGTLYVANLIHHQGLALDVEKHNIQYEAISHSWGIMEHKNTIKCNGVMVMITASLHAALQRLRLTDMHRYLWIDVICINQDDDREKSMQIQNMFLIFRKALQVIAWLGEENNNEHEALGYLQRNPTLLPTENGESQNATPLLRGLQSVCQREWFRRTWVRQEVFAAGKLTLQVGETALPWEDFVMKLQAVADREIAEANQIADPFKSIQLLRRARAQVATLLLSGIPIENEEDAERLSLDYVLRGSAHFDATDERDYIYGVLGMTTTSLVTADRKSSTEASSHLHHRPADEVSLPLDYSQAITQIFEDVTKYIIDFHRCLDVVLLAHHARSTINSLHHTKTTPLELPSWVPDWRFLPTFTPLDHAWVLIDQQRKQRLFDRLRKIKSFDTEAASRTNTSLCAKHCGRFTSEKPRLYRDATLQEIGSHSPDYGQNQTRPSTKGTITFRGSLLGYIVSTPPTRKTLGQLVRSFFSRFSTIIKAGQLSGYKSTRFAPSTIKTSIDNSDRDHKKGDDEDDEESRNKDDDDDDDEEDPDRPYTEGWSEDGSHMLDTSHIGVSDVRKGLEGADIYVPEPAQDGDLVILPDGCSLLMVLRPVAHSNSAHVNMTEHSNGLGKVEPGASTAETATTEADSQAQLETRYRLIGAAYSDHYVLHESYRRVNTFERFNGDDGPEGELAFPKLGPLILDIAQQDFVVE